MHQERNESFLRQEQVGRQLNAVVLYLINELELSIYRFLTFGAKKIKKQSQPVEFGVDQFTNRWSI